MTTIDRTGCGSTSGKHGDLSAYRKGCRCDDARRLNTRHQTLYRLRAQRAGQPLSCDPTGTRRRLQALMAIGWPCRVLSARLGITPSALGQIQTNKRTRTSTARRVGDLYRELSDQTGPSADTRGRARSLGYPPPLAWDDDTIDDPAAEPACWERRPNARIRSADRAEDIAFLRRVGVPDWQIAERLDIDDGSLSTYLKRAAA